MKLAYKGKEFINLSVQEEKTLKIYSGYTDVSYQNRTFTISGSERCSSNFYSLEDALKENPISLDIIFGTTREVKIIGYKDGYTLIWDYQNSNKPYNWISGKR